MENNFLSLVIGFIRHFNSSLGGKMRVQISLQSGLQLRGIVIDEIITFIDPIQTNVFSSVLT
jgi:hypothetical protein